MSAQPVPNAVQEAAGAWFARRRSGAMTPHEARALEAWLAQDTRHLAAFEMIERAWGGVEDARRAPEILALRERARGRRSGLTRAVVSRAAAACLALAVIGAGGYGLKASGVIDLRRFSNQEYATRVGEKTSVTLPDGSVVTLNTDTVLRTRASRERRIVYLDRGQAYFRVAKDAERPFEVHAAGRTVTALGTAFDVRVDGGRFEVTLVEGKVRVSAPVKPVAAPATPGAPAVRTTEMLAGDQFVATTDREWSVARTDPTRETSWLVGRLKFEGEPLGDVVDEFNRYSQRKVVIDDPALAARPVSGAFRADDQDAFIEALEIAHLAVVQSETDEVVRLARP
ncbi:MAG TPA: FecR domain-containing protein [Caulobacteraceae bacterium]|nr:FecR domain-containing protein [Caulobacteraceae bacterium]